MAIFSKIASNLIPSPGRFPQVETPLFDKNVIGSAINTAIRNPRELKNFLKGQTKQAGNRLLSQVVGVLLNGNPVGLGSSPSNVDPNSWYAKAASRVDPAFSFDWNVSLELGGAVLPPQYIERIEFPNWTVEVESVLRGRFNVAYASMLTNNGTFEIECYEDQRLTVSRYFTRWRNSMISQDGTTFLPIEYKGKLTVFPKDAKQNDIGIFVIDGIFPSNLPTWSFESENSNRHTPLIQFSYDRISFVHIDSADVSSLIEPNTNRPQTVGDLISAPIQQANDFILNSVGEFRETVLDNAVIFGNKVTEKFNTFGNQKNDVNNTVDPTGLEFGSFDINDSLTA